MITKIELYTYAKELEKYSGLKEEMTMWDKEFSQDGLDDIEVKAYRIHLRGFKVEEKPRE